MDPRFHELLDIRSGVDAAFRYHDPIVGNKRGELQRGLDIGRECFEVSVVDADDLGSCGEGLVELFFGMYLDQGCETESFTDPKAALARLGPLP